MTNRQALSISLEDTPALDDVRFVQQGLQTYNLLYAPDDGYKPLTLFLRSVDGTIFGGLLGETYWGWLHISILWLDETARRQGYGERLLALAEQEAVRRGCHAAHLDTMSFQALPFYEKNGYTVFGVLNDLPVGHSRYFMKKALGA